MFSDIEGSTQLLLELGDGYVDLLHRHNDIFREVILEYGGVEISPRKIFIGPNIGIGDELIFFELARRLRNRFSSAWIRVSSSKDTLWSLAPEID